MRNRTSLACAVSVGALLVGAAGVAAAAPDTAQPEEVVVPQEASPELLPEFGQDIPMLANGGEVVGFVDRDEFMSAGDPGDAPPELSPPPPPPPIVEVHTREGRTVGVATMYGFVPLPEAVARGWASPDGTLLTDHM